MKLKLRKLYKPDRCRTYWFGLSIPPAFRHLVGGKKEIFVNTGAEQKDRAQKIQITTLQNWLLKFQLDSQGREWLMLTEESIKTIISTVGFNLIAKFEDDRASGRMASGVVHSEWMGDIQSLKDTAELAISFGGREPISYFPVREYVSRYADVRIAPDIGMDPLAPTLALRFGEQMLPIATHLEGMLGGKITTPAPRPTIARTAGVVSSGKAYTLFDAFERWKATQSRQKTIDTRLAMVRMLHEFCGGKTITEITADDCSRLKTDLLTGKYKPFRKAVSSLTVRNYLIGLKPILKEAVAAGWIETNPLDKVKPPPKTHTLQSTANIPYTLTQLMKLFGPGGPYNAPETAQDAFPLLALYTGARLEELAQLTRSDLIEMDGRWWLQLHNMKKATPDAEDVELEAAKDTQRSIKNTNSLRTIPVHQALCANGFMDWLHKQAPADGNIWGTGANLYNQQGAGISKKWGRNCRALKVPTRLHRLRHTWTHMAMVSDIEFKDSDRYVGHIESWVENQGYGAGAPVVRTRAMRIIDMLRIWDPDTNEEFDVSCIKLPFQQPGP